MMKKSVFLVLLAIISCQKQSPEVQKTATAAEVSNNFQKNYSAKNSLPKKDSLAKASTEIKNNSTGNADRSENGNTITRTADAGKLPLTITENFEKSGQTLVINIKNFKKNKISVSVHPENPAQNIRINRIILNGSNADGPFGREIKNYSVPGSGEIRIVVGRSNMASGEDAGAFRVAVE